MSLLASCCTLWLRDLAVGFVYLSRDKSLNPYWGSRGPVPFPLLGTFWRSLFSQVDLPWPVDKHVFLSLIPSPKPFFSFFPPLSLFKATAHSAYAAGLCIKPPSAQTEVDASQSKISVLGGKTVGITFASWDNWWMNTRWLLRSQPQYVMTREEHWAMTKLTITSSCLWLTAQRDV